MKIFIASLWIYSLVLKATAEDGLNRLSTAEAEAGRELLFTYPDSAVAEEVQRPNILWIIAEDMSPDLGCYGNKVVATPNIDLLAAKGMKFNQVFTTGPACSPSRTALATGVYQTTLGASSHALQQRAHSGPS